MSAPEKNLLEWTVFGASLVVIAACVGLLVYGATSSSGEDSPDLHVETQPAVRSSGGYTVPVGISNRGKATAEQVRIEVSLVENGRELEKVELILAFVPRHSRREAAVVFRRDPRCCAVSARAVGYEMP